MWCRSRRKTSSCARRRRTARPRAGRPTCPRSSSTTRRSPPHSRNGPSGAWARRPAAPPPARRGGRVAGAAPRTPDDSGENAAGNLIADSQLAATDDEAGAVAAFMNPGGVRSDFPAGAVSYGAAFTVQPFGNTLTTMTLTGAQVLELLGEQWCGQTTPRVLLPSSTVSYAYSAAAAAAATGQPCGNVPNPVSDVRIGGVPLDPATPYRITVNSFLAGGGDLFGVLPS